MRDYLFHLLERCPSGAYADARYEYRTVSELALNERGAQLSSQEKTGGLCRIVGGRGAAHVAFTEPQAAFPLIDREAHNPLLNTTSKISAPARQVVQVQARPQQPIEEKVDTLREYHSLLSGFRQVKQASLYFRQERCHKFFANCAGTFLEQDPQWTFCLLSALVENGQWAVQVLSTTEGLPQDGRAQIEQLGHWTESLRSAAIPPKGRYTVVLDPQLAGAVIHETIGHLSEADNAARSASVRKHLSIGKPVSIGSFSVVDDASLPGFSGSYAYDDEGVAGRRTVLVREGTVVSKLHTLRTAAEWDAESTGNARAADFACEPIVRCSNTMVCPGGQTVEELIESVADGLYLRGVRGGRTYGDTFVYAVCGGNRIRNGRLAEPVGNVTIRSEVTDFLGNIAGVGDHIPRFSSPFCIKRGQPWMPVWSGSPALKVMNVQLEA